MQQQHILRIECRRDGVEQPDVACGAYVVTSRGEPRKSSEYRAQLVFGPSLTK